MEWKTFTAVWQILEVFAVFVLRTGKNFFTPLADVKLCRPPAIIYAFLCGFIIDQEASVKEEYVSILAGIEKL